MSKTTNRIARGAGQPAKPTTPHPRDWERALDQTYGRLGWSQAIERCTSSVWSVQGHDGARYAAFAAATVSLSVGPPASPLTKRQAPGYHESTPQPTAGQAIALAEERAVAEGLSRCAEGLLGDRPLRDLSAAASPRGAPLNRGDVLGDMATLRDEEPVSPELMNQLWQTARHLHGREGASALWAALDLAPAHTPQGRHARRLLDLLDLNHSLTRGAA